MPWSGTALSSDLTLGKSLDETLGPESFHEQGSVRESDHDVRYCPFCGSLGQMSGESPLYGLAQPDRFAMQATSEQRSLCQRYGVIVEPPIAGTRIGIALQTIQNQPLNGLRVPPTETNNGWYLWGGERWSDSPDFFQPMCIEHIADYCLNATPFLALPAGWRFLTDGIHVDVWFDPQLLKSVAP